MLLASFGPWGMFSWSERNQVRRMENILTESGILENGRIKNEVSWKKSSDSTLIASSKRELNSLPKDQLNEVNSIIHYLESYHGMEALFPWIAPETADYFESKDIIEPSHAQLMAETLGIKYLLPYNSYDSVGSDSNEYTEFSSIHSESVEISGYDHLIRFVIYPSYERGEVEELRTGPDYSFSKPIGIDEKLILTWKGKEINLQTAAFMESLTQKHGRGLHPSLPQESLTQLVKEDSLEIKVVYQKIGFNKVKDQKESYERLSGLVLIRKMEPSVP